MSKTNKKLSDKHIDICEKVLASVSIEHKLLHEENNLIERLNAIKAERTKHVNELNEIREVFYEIVTNDKLGGMFGDDELETVFSTIVNTKLKPKQQKPQKTEIKSDYVIYEHYASGSILLDKVHQLAEFIKQNPGAKKNDICQALFFNDDKEYRTAINKLSINYKVRIDGNTRARKYYIEVN